MSFTSPRPAVSSRVVLNSVVFGGQQGHSNQGLLVPAQAAQAPDLMRFEMCSSQVPRYASDPDPHNGLGLEAIIPSFAATTAAA